MPSQTHTRSLQLVLYNIAVISLSALWGLIKRTTFEWTKKMFYCKVRASLTVSEKVDAIGEAKKK
jgi:hypothetical protein